jgi:putative transposase
MNTFYSVMGISKQALHQHNDRQLTRLEKEERLMKQAVAIRSRHPGIGCRTLYDLVEDIGLGRDKTEAFLLSNGFRLKRKVNFIKTTIRQRLYKFPNLIKGIKIRGINAVWQTDITYFMLPCGMVCYLIFIIDIYSRRILGYKANNHMRSEANLECLKMAFRIRENDSLATLIHHSDYGGQYVSKKYLEALRSRGISISMCELAWQNAYTERINGTIKNDYLKNREIFTLHDLRKNLDTDVHAYNSERPHKNLPDRMSPFQFEAFLKNTPKSKHPTLKVFNHDEYQKSSLSLT